MLSDKGIIIIIDNVNMIAIFINKPYNLQTCN